MTRRRCVLRRGDTVGVVATGFAVRPSRLRDGIGALEAMGYRVVAGQGVLDRHGYLAGDDATRAGDLRAMLLDPDVRCIWFARGGYGTARILDRLPWRALRDRPKILVGYSDLTALFSAFVRRTAHVCLHGPVVAELGQASAYHRLSLRRMLGGQSVLLRVRSRQVLAEGKARGQLVGGNLTVLAHSLGTRFAPDLRGKVLFLEEVGEEAYRIDRALTQLRLAGALRRLEGVLLGHFAVPRARRRFPPDRAVDSVLAEAFRPLGIPVVAGVPAGHVAGKWTLPIGGRVEVDTGAGKIEFSP